MAEDRHRLFAGCPLPSDVARQLHAWASEKLVGPGVRVEPAENLHVTLMFFDFVDSAKRDQLVALTKQVVWNSIEVRASSAKMFGRSAYGVELAGPFPALEALNDRFLHGIRYPEADEQAEAPWSADAFTMLALSVPDVERAKQSRRCQHEHRMFELHVTVARTNGRVQPATPPAIAFLLDRFALYESHLGPGGSSYTVLAEASASE